MLFYRKASSGKIPGAGRLDGLSLVLVILFSRKISEGYLCSM
jgi:hypothetical protein